MAVASETVLARALQRSHEEARKPSPPLGAADGVFVLWLGQVHSAKDKMSPADFVGFEA